MFWWISFEVIKLFGKENMTSPAKFKKDKEIIAEYDTQVKGKEWFYFHPFGYRKPASRLSEFAVDVWVGKREIICRLPGICRAFFRNTKLGRVCSAVSRPHGAVAALVVPFLRYHSGGFLWNTHDFEFGEIHIFLPAALKGGFACEIREAGNCFLILCLSWESLNNLCSVRGAYFHCW